MLGFFSYKYRQQYFSIWKAHMRDKRQYYLGVALQKEAQYFSVILHPDGLHYGWHIGIGR